MYRSPWALNIVLVLLSFLYLINRVCIYKHVVYAIPTRMKHRKFCHFQVVLRDLAKIHSLFLLRQAWLDEQPWLERVTGEKMASMKPLFSALLQHAHTEFPEFWNKEMYVCMLYV